LRIDGHLPAESVTFSGGRRARRKSPTVIRPSHMHPRIYTDTSVIGGYFDSEFEAASQALFRHFSAGKATLVISDITLLELAPAPERIRQLVDAVPSEYVEEVRLTSEAEELADSYISSGVIGASSRADAEHIATATIHRVTVLVSWNLKHIVNLERIHGYNSVNLRLGYPMIEIRTPIEVIEHES